MFPIVGIEQGLNKNLQNEYMYESLHAKIIIQEYSGLQ